LHIDTIRRRVIATTNAIDCLISRPRHVKRNVMHWRGGQMVLRWTTAAVLKMSRHSEDHINIEDFVAV
jgi:hypothetical protein